jgi:hypothetical protein
MNSDGTIDTSFSRGVLPYSPEVYRMALQSDGKIIFSSGNLYRLNTNGVDDSSFNPGTGPNPSIGGYSALVLQTDGKILISGKFTAFNGTNINRIARLNGDASPPTGLQFLTANLYFGTYLNGTVSNTYRLEWTTDLITPSLWTPLFDLTLQTNPQFILDPSPISGQQRFYRAVALP